MKPARANTTLSGSINLSSEALDKNQIKCELAADALKASGTLRLRALGFSMLPSIWPGDVLTIQSQDSDECSVGDIVLYMSAGYFFIHRVSRVSDSGDLIVKGDGLPQSDPPVQAQQVLGKVVAIEHDGRHFQPSQASTSAGILARSIWRSGFLLRFLMATRSRWPARRNKLAKPPRSFMQWV